VSTAARGPVPKRVRVISGTAPRLTCLVAVGLVTLTACGSTVARQPGSATLGAGDVSSGAASGTSQSSRGTGLPGAADNGLTPAGQSVTPGLGGSTQSSGAGGNAIGGGPGSASGTGSGSTGTTTSSNRPASSSGRGFTATTIKIGIVTTSNGTEAAKSLGVKGVNPGDQVAQYQAVADYIAKHGGILGRKITFAAYDLNVLASANNPDSSAQAACTYFTEDQHVFAVVNSIPLPSMRACLQQHNTPTIDAGQTTISQSEYNKYASIVYGAGEMTSDLVYRLEINSLVERGFFTGWDTLNGTPGSAPVKIGLLYPDTIDGRAIWQIKVRTLAAHGFKVTDTVSYPGTLDGATSANQSAVLRFKQDGITHVIGAGLVFWENADNQHYRPRYEILPGGGYLVAQNAPPTQMHGAMTVGWQPTNDVDAAHDPGDPSAATTLCKSIMKAAGQDYTDRSTLASMEQNCDVLFTLRDSLTKTGQLTLPGLRAGIEGLGTRWLSAQTWISNFSPRQHASASAVRDQIYNDTCSCFVYTNKTNRTA
jgi:hypothetical protein